MRTMYENNKQKKTRSKKIFNVSFSEIQFSTFCELNESRASFYSNLKKENFFAFIKLPKQNNKLNISLNKGF